ncbi:MAG: quinolinate synthase NadA, partial [SAR202 cluster bacterium]|nr:quinolinate synthase NadA [SAR202 cluster bacterium]
MCGGSRFPRNTCTTLPRNWTWRLVKLGSTVTILGHHYQREEVIKYADFQGDSFLLSREVATRPEADYIIFCGVHFMVEAACILAAFD